MLQNIVKYLLVKQGGFLYMLNEKEKKKYEIIEKVINGLITKKEAMVELNLTRQQIYRLVIKYHADGEIGFSHKKQKR